MRDSSVCFILWGFIKVLHKICKTENNKAHQDFLLGADAQYLMKVTLTICESVSQWFNSLLSKNIFVSNILQLKSWYKPFDNNDADKMI